MRVRYRYRYWAPRASCILRDWRACLDARKTDSGTGQLRDRGNRILGDLLACRSLSKLPFLYLIRHQSVAQSKLFVSIVRVRLIFCIKKFGKNAGTERKPEPTTIMWATNPIHSEVLSIWEIMASTSKKGSRVQNPDYCRWLTAPNSLKFNRMGSLGCWGTKFFTKFANWP